jgi:CDGSH-type Zn-finger protein
MTTVRLRKNGPYVLEAEDVRVVDWDGQEYVVSRQPVALCRCGASARKPFCDGTHARIGFDGGPAAHSEPQDSAQDPAQGPEPKA